MKRILLFCLVICAGANALAQQASPTPSPTRPPLPPGPLLKPVPDHTKWTITSVTKLPADATPEQKAAASTVIIGEKSGKTAHVLTIKAKGLREEQWTDGKLLATTSPAAKEMMFTTGAIDRIPLPGWVSANSFSEIQTQGGKDYLIFRAKVAPTGTEVVVDMEHPNQDNSEPLKVEAIATIEDETRLPVAVKEGGMTTIYKFEPLSPDAEIIPATIQADLASREKKMQDAIRKPVHP